MKFSINLLNWSDHIIDRPWMNYREQFTLFLELFGNQARFYNHEIIYELCEPKWINFIKTFHAMKKEDFVNPSQTDLNNFIEFVIVFFEIKIFWLQQINNCIEKFVLNFIKIHFENIKFDAQKIRLYAPASHSYRGCHMDTLYDILRIIVK
jgi:hypothetical protein